MPNSQLDNTVAYRQNSCSNGLEFHSFEQQNTGRVAIEKRISATYQQEFDAKLAHFMPMLVSANIPGQASHISFGLSAAGEQTLFLENYLTEPVEQALSSVANTEIDRASIVEVGNLAFTSTGNLRSDLAAIAYHCYELGYQYAVCTATRLLRLALAKTGMTPLYLGRARLVDAPQDGTRWGKYYDASPQIIGGNLLLSAERLLGVQKQQ